MHPPTAILKHVVDEYNFSIISNVFNNNKPHAQSTHNQKCMNKMHHKLFDETLRFRGKNFHQNLRLIVQKVLKWPLQYVSFQIFLGEHTPVSPTAFYILRTFKIILTEKIRLKICANTLENMCKFHLTEKNSDYAEDIKTFFKWPFTSFLGLTSLYSVNIQPNSKFHPPYQTA